MAGVTRVRLPWFKCEPTALLGALVEMDASEGYLYTIILLRIYETGGPIQDDRRALSNRSKIRIDLVNRALNSLAEKGKITVENGKIDCEYTKKRLVEREHVQGLRKIAGQISASIRWQKAQVNQPNGSTRAQHMNNTPIHIKKDIIREVSAVPAEDRLSRMSEPLEVSPQLLAINRAKFGG